MVNASDPPERSRHASRAHLALFPRKLMIAFLQRTSAAWLITTLPTRVSSTSCSPCVAMYDELSVEFASVRLTLAQADPHVGVRLRTQGQLGRFRQHCALHQGFVASLCCALDPCLLAQPSTTAGSFPLFVKTLIGKVPFARSLATRTDPQSIA